jgi:hypothetical protein
MTELDSTVGIIARRFHGLGRPSQATHLHTKKVQPSTVSVGGFQDHHPNGKCSLPSYLPVWARLTAPDIEELYPLDRQSRIFTRRMYIINNQPSFAMPCSLVIKALTFRDISSGKTLQSLCILGGFRGKCFIDPQAAGHKFPCTISLIFPPHLGSNRGRNRFRCPDPRKRHINKARLSMSVNTTRHGKRLLRREWS